jgi:bifunctional DNA-binding transcriptional regulator/antitoxin component of YhaV-PrlF toxin-antitoxin module
MSKITAKFQVTLPKAVADHYSLSPGDDIEWVPAGDVIRVIPSVKKATSLSLEARLRLFDQATERNLGKAAVQSARARGWTREELYGRGRAH